MRYELTDREWAAIRPMLPNKPRGFVAIGRTVARPAEGIRPIYDLL
jgi:transposase